MALATWIMSEADPDAFRTSNCNQRTPIRGGFRPASAENSLVHSGGLTKGHRAGYLAGEYFLIPGLVLRSNKRRQKERFRAKRLNLKHLVRVLHNPP